jgi:hypothetical protein
MFSASFSTLSFLSPTFIGRMNVKPFTKKTISFCHQAQLFPSYNTVIGKVMKGKVFVSFVVKLTIRCYRGERVLRLLGNCEQKTFVGLKTPQ